MDITDVRLNNLRKLIKKYGSQAKLSRAADLNGGKLATAYLSQLVNKHRLIRERSARNIELQLGLDAGSLDEKSDDQAHISNLGKYRVGSQRNAVVIALTDAGTGAEVIDSHPLAEGIDTHPIDSSYSDDAYVLIVTGDSMTNPNDHNRSFPEHCKIVVEPNEQWSVNSFVIARLNGSDVTFKQIIKDGDTYYLKALNSVYGLKKIDDSVEIIGVVKERLGQKF